MSGAIHMVAFGVLKYDPPREIVRRGDDEGWARHDAAVQIAKLVEDACVERGWLLMKNHRVPNAFELLGPLKSQGASWRTRVKIGYGTLERVCQLAVAFEEDQRRMP